MNILISGGNFVNKGAEAMLFTTVNECLSIFGNPNFILQLPEGFVRINSLEELVVLSNQKVKEKSLHESSKLDKLITLLSSYKEADIMLDISGLELCSKLGIYPSLRYLFKIAISKFFRTKVFLMPQSFGPFTYGKGVKQWFMIKLVSHYMKYPSICYAREKDGSYKLKGICKEANILLSCDMVLQNKSVESLLLRKDMGFETLPTIKEKSVGFVPNKRMYEQYGKAMSLECYLNIIGTVRNQGYNIYILCHASDDLDVAHEIKEMFKYDHNIFVVEKILSCFQYQKLANDFDFIVASRYHSIVHAYKDCIPAIAIGWAVKYKELLALMKQDKYLLKVNDDKQTIFKTVLDMVNQYEKERTVISKELSEIQRYNCFENVEHLVKE